MPGSVNSNTDFEKTRDAMRVSARTSPILVAAVAIPLLLQQRPPSKASELTAPGRVRGDNATTLLPAPIAQRQQIRIEADTNRPGGDYKDYDVRDGGVEVCQKECASDAGCGSFTFVKPGFRGRFGHCFLKRGAPKPVADRCCISGVKSLSR